MESDSGTKTNNNNTNNVIITTEGEYDNNRNIKQLIPTATTSNDQEYVSCIGIFVLFCVLLCVMDSITSNI